MNEKIKELTTQATTVVNNPYCNSDGKPVVDNFEEHFSIGKFAELIVAECIAICGPDDSYTDDWFKAKADSVSKIKQHFGVEE